MRREEFTVGRLIRSGSSNGAVTVLETNEDGLVTIAKCATGSIPSAVAGYAIGCLLIDTTTGKLYYNSNTAASCTFNSIADIASAEIAANAITPIKMGTRTLVALADAAATPTIAQLMTSSVFTMTPSVARNFTTPTAALIVAGLTGATVGSWFDFTVVNLADYPITIVAGDAGVTLVGPVVINKGGATFRAVLTNVTGAAEALSIYRTDGVADLTATGTELNFLDTALAGTVVNSKSAIYDAAGKLFRSSATPAAAGADITDATALTAELNAVTGADGAKGVKLPTEAANQIVVVVNTSAASNLLVYPSVAGSQINALGAGAAYTVTPGQVAVFIGRSASLWYVAAATDTITGLTASAAELNLNDGTTAGTVVASKTVAVDAQKAVDTLRATAERTLGGTGVPGAAKVQTEITKAVTAFSNTVAKTVFTVTIPNAVHAALIEVDSLGVLGAGGAIGAGEACKNSKYHVTVARTTGVNAVAAVSAEVGTGAMAKVAGANDLTSVVVTTGAVAGAVGGENTFTIQVAITKAAGASDNHTGVFTARLLNQNATGITLA